MVLRNSSRSHHFSVVIILDIAQGFDETQAEAGDQGIVNTESEVAVLPLEI